MTGARRPVFYLEIPPGLFSTVVRGLGDAGVTENARVVVEKPFGHDLASARELNRGLDAVLDEPQILRIDPYLGKEPVLDIAYLRFANTYEGYLDVYGVAGDSTTETYVALELEIDNWRWSGVCFFIRAGKCMPTTATEANVIFKRPPRLGVGPGARPGPNQLVIRIDPRPGARIRFISKRPGKDTFAPADLTVLFEHQPDGGPTPYERLLGDALRANPATGLRLVPRRLCRLLHRLPRPEDLNQGSPSARGCSTLRGGGTTPCSRRQGGRPVERRARRRHEVANGALGGSPSHAPVSRRSRGRRPAFVPVLVAIAAVSTACGEDSPSVLDPSSGAGRRVEGLWWVLFWISAVVVAVVTAFILVAARRRRAGPGEEEAPADARDVDTRPVPWGDRFVVLAGVVVPGGILAGTFVFSLGVFNDLADPPDEPVVEVEVVAHTWWWEVRYPNGAVTANEIRIPAGETVELALPTADVIHSFWVPELQVKKDHIPGSDNRLWLVADRAGRFRGQCAEFCGLQHAHMEFEVVALEPDEFEDWLERETGPAVEPQSDEGREGAEIFAASSCAGCHAVRGTSADGDLGPDLTHLADRRTIGAGLIPLTPGNLADFVTDPQDDKPGVSMPPTELSPREVDAVVAYLMELE